METLEAKSLIDNCPYNTGDFQEPITYYGFPDKCQECAVQRYYDHIKIIKE